MKVTDLCNYKELELINDGGTMDRVISKPFCCDLLSIAMGKAPADCCWVTVMANMNTLAVASLADAACIILAESSKFDDATIAKAKEQNINIFYTSLPVFDAALLVYGFSSNHEAD